MENLLKALKQVREKSKRRNFVQTFELIVNLRDIDLKNPQNRLNEIVILPHPPGKEATIVVFSDIWKEEELGVKVLKSQDIEALGKNKREAKKLAKRTDFFFAEPRLMPLIGKNLGQILGPRGKIPRVVTSNPKPLIEAHKKAVRIRLKESPVIQCAVGKENMDDKAIAENIQTILNFLEEKLPKGKHNLKNVLIKLTMGPPVEVELNGKRRKG